MNSREKDDLALLLAGADNDVLRAASFVRGGGGVEEGSHIRET